MKRPAQGPGSRGQGSVTPLHQHPPQRTMVRTCKADTPPARPLWEAGAAHSALMSQWAVPGAPSEGRQSSRLWVSSPELWATKVTEGDLAWSPQSLAGLSL